MSCPARSKPFPPRNHSAPNNLPLGETDEQKTPSASPARSARFPKKHPSKKAPKFRVWELTRTEVLLLVLVIVLVLLLLLSAAVLVIGTRCPVRRASSTIARTSHENE